MGKPSKFNPVSLLIYLVLAGALYGGVQFGPAYYRKWDVKGILSEAANRAYSKRMVTGPGKQEFLDKLAEKTEKKLLEAGIEDEQLRVRFSETNSSITAQAMYREIINHPLVSKQTILYFRPHYTIEYRKD